MNNEIKCIISDLYDIYKLFDYNKNYLKDKSLKNSLILHSIINMYYSFYYFDKRELKSFIVVYNKFNMKLRHEIINNQELSMYSFYSIDNFINNMIIPTYKSKILVYD
jgi:hypothetical protein